MYKNYTINQVVLPIDLSILIPSDDISVAIHHFVDSIPEAAFQTYSSEFGRPKYHPRMMLAIILCAYAQGITSGRKIEDLLSDSIRMRWLAQEERPNFRTINRFRVHPVMDTLLAQGFVQFRAALLRHGLIQGEALFIDGTKIEADANKFSFVWGRSIKRFEQQLDEKAMERYRQLVKEEILPDLLKEMQEELTSEELKEIREQLLSKKQAVSEKMEQTEDVPTRKALRKDRSKLHKAGKAFSDFSERKEKYAASKKILGTRNSYSKTDQDATFMRMKDDAMKNGQLKAGYNVQLATENQFVLAYETFPNSTDTRTLIPFLETIKGFFDLPEYIVADAGYGSEENYHHLLDEEERTPLITYGLYRKEQKRKYKKDPFRRENWFYNETEDYFLCPNGRRLLFKNYSKRTDKAGFTRDFKNYECENCTGCPLRSKCTRAKEGKNRKIYLNPTWEYFKAHVREWMRDEKTEKIYKQRKIDIEPVFGDIKRNMGFVRFTVRGAQKIKRELGVVLLAHNFRKLTAGMKVPGTKTGNQRLVEG